MKTIFTLAFNKIKGIVSSVISNSQAIQSKAKDVSKKIKDIKIDTGNEEKAKRNKWYHIPFFYSRGKFNVPFFWITVFCFQVSGIVGLKFYAVVHKIKNNTFTTDDLSDTLLIALLGFILTWIALYNNDKNKNNPQV